MQSKCGEVTFFAAALAGVGVVGWLRRGLVESLRLLEQRPLNLVFFLFRGRWLPVRLVAHCLEILVQLALSKSFYGNLLLETPVSRHVTPRCEELLFYLFVLKLGLLAAHHGR